MDIHNQSTRAVSAAVRGLAAAALDWLYPPRCLACDDDIAETGALCRGCWAETRFIDAPLCRRCGGPLAFAVEETPDLFDAAPTCPACRDRPMRWREARAAVVYGGAARRLALGLKRGDRLEAARPMGAWMARAGADLLGPDREEDGGQESGQDAGAGGRPWVIPAPLHWRRRLARRSNQSEALAATIARISGAPLAVGALRRVRATPSLQGLSPAARTAALDGAIQVTARWRSRLDGARAVVVDDVLTTGATLNACADALHAAGVRRVDVIAFARAGRGLSEEGGSN